MDAGLAALRDLVADYTSAFARRILDSGAIVHARSTAPEFSCRASPTRAVGRHAQPVEPGVRRGRIVRRRRRVAGVRDDDAGQRLGHRRLDPHPRLVLRRRRLQAAVRARALTRRSTSTLLPLGRWLAPSPTARCSRTRSPARTRPTSPRCGRGSSCPLEFSGVEGLRIAVVGRPRRLPDRPRGGAEHDRRGRGVRGGRRVVEGSSCRSRRGRSTRVAPSTSADLRRIHRRDVRAHPDTTPAVHRGLRAALSSRPQAEDERPASRAWRSRRTGRGRWAHCSRTTTRSMCPNCGTRGLVAGDDYADTGSGSEAGCSSTTGACRDAATYNVDEPLGPRQCRPGSPTTGCPRASNSPGARTTIDGVPAARRYERVRPWSFDGVFEVASA